MQADGNPKKLAIALNSDSKSNPGSTNFSQCPHNLDASATRRTAISTQQNLIKSNKNQGNSLCFLKHLTYSYV